MFSCSVKFVSIPGIEQTGRWMTENWQRSRRTLLGDTPVVAVGYLSATLW